jgi:8-oxo-dGTP pyrophosphatase MutT (NUDIX family)
MIMREVIQKMIQAIRPGDALEAQQLADTLRWIESGVEIFRVEKPATPPKHLVSYFVLVDPAEKKIMLVDHIKAGLWLPAGGHIEKDEHPKTTVEREIQEELHMPADFLSPEPLLLTQAVTVNMAAGHTDVSLWYVVRADSKKKIDYDPREFNGCRWFGYDELLATDISKLDPHMHRFVRKFLQSDLNKTH